jgi:hypothetical protein
LQFVSEAREPATRMSIDLLGGADGGVGHGGGMRGSGVDGVKRGMMLELVVGLSLGHLSALMEIACKFQ